MKSLPKPVNLEIKIDEWQAAQGNIEAVRVVGLSWRKARTDPTLEPLLAALPPTSGFVPIKLSDARTEMAPRAWKGLRFGKGPPIYESARKHFEAWASDDYFERARDSTMVTMIRRLVPNFDDYSREAQIDFIDRTQNKIEKVRESVEDLVNHLTYAAPDKGKAVPPIKEPGLKVRAAVFSALMGTRGAGELLGIPHSDKTSYENQAVRKMTEVGRRLLCDYYGAVQFATKIERMQGYHEWWTWLNSKAPKKQMYVLLAKARRTSAELEKRRAEEDGFDEKLGEWVHVVERRLEANEAYERSADPATKENARLMGNQLVSRQIEIEGTDTRFKEALDAIESPPSLA